MKKGQLFIISGPSRVGKDTIINAITANKKLDLKRVITFTSRPPKPDDVENVTLKFVSETEFRKKIREGFFLEYAPVRGYHFGSPKKEIEDLLEQGKNVLIHIEIQGTKQVCQKIPDVITIFILPDSTERLRQRMRQAHFSPEQIKIRWKETLRELKEAKNYDYRVVNPEGHPEKAIKQVEKIIEKNIIN